MSDNEMWYTNLKQILFTHFKVKVLATLDGAYENINFTNDDRNTEETKLPTVLFEELTPVERGNTLDNTSVNGVSETIQITVYSNERYDTKTIMNACVGAMKSLRFSVPGFPIYETNHDIKYGVARFRRVIAESDTL